MSLTAAQLWHGVIALAAVMQSPVQAQGRAYVSQPQHPLPASYLCCTCYVAAYLKGLPAIATLFGMRVIPLRAFAL